MPSRITQGECNRRKGTIRPKIPHYSREYVSFRYAMPKSSSILLALFLLLYPLSAFPGEPPIARYAPGELLVKFRRGLSTARVTSIHRSLGSEVIERLKDIHIDRIVLPDGWSVEEAISFYRADPDVEYAEPNYIRRALLTPNDPHLNELWGLHNTGQTGGTEDADIDAPEAWDTQTDCSSVVIAIPDTGADLDHEDLKESIWRNTGEDWSNGSPGNNGVDDDSNGKIDDYYGWDFVNSDNDPDDDNSTEEEYHGTHVTGIIAAQGNNGLGITGVCWSASIMQLKILDSGGDGTVADELGAIGYAIDKGANIINLSLGGAGYSTGEYEAIKNAGDAGMLFVAAAGNDGTDNDDSPVYPASYNLDNIISVTATDDNDELPSWANYGITSVDVGAPGFEIYSTKAGDSYQYISGSSMAAPHVAGLAALIWAHDSTLTYSEVKDFILNGVDAKPALGGNILSGGRINANNSLLKSLSAPSNLLATALSGGYIDLSWTDNSYGETGFKIERKTDSGGTYSEIAAVSSGVTSYRDTGLSASTAYFYRVQAYTSSSHSSYSNEAHAPAAPSNLSAKGVSTSQIDLTWTDNSMYEDGFKIERKTGTGGTYSEIATVDSDVTSYSNTGLSEGSIHIYRVRAYHAGGLSLYSNEVAGTTLCSSCSSDHGCFIATTLYGYKDQP
jgi:subtilisin family serine protease